MDFNEYIDGAVNTNGGRFLYHVGHINPLTRGGKHAFTNIAWTSDDGNRIQGNDTLDEIEDKLVSAVIFHLERDASSPTEAFHSKLTRLEDIINQLKKQCSITNRLKEASRTKEMLSMFYPSVSF